MILLDKAFSFKGILKPGLITLISVFLGCETAEDVGVNFPIETGIAPNFVEFTLPASNVYIDSLRTDQENFVIAGGYSDPITGSATAEGYVTLSYVSGTLPDDEFMLTYEYDSIRISMEITESLLSSADSSQSIVLGELENVLSPSLVYLSSLKQDTVRKIGQVDYKVKNADESNYINFQLDDDFGNDLFDQGFGSSSLVAEDWPSLSISTEGNNEILNNLSLLSDTSLVYLYVRHPDGIIEEDSTTRDTTYQVEFRLAGRNYSYIERDNSSSEFAGIVENTDFNLADERTVIDPLMGISTTFSIAEIADFFDSNPNIIIGDAKISFEIDDNIIRDTLESFGSYFRKLDNSYFAPAIFSPQSILSSTIATDASYSSTMISLSVGYLNRNFRDNNKNSISLNCTLFMNSLLRNYLNSGELQFLSRFEDNPQNISEFILINQINSSVGESILTFDRTIFQKDGIKLRIYYTELGD